MHNPEKHKERRAALLNILGPFCVRCKSTEELEFDHIDPSTKLFKISDRLAAGKWETLLKEVAKCQILCDTCHNAKSLVELGGKPLHGSINQYRRYKCRCEPCKATWNAKCREWKANYKIRKSRA